LSDTLGRIAALDGKGDDGWLIDNAIILVGIDDGR
jgi:hypothetical protein